MKTNEEQVRQQYPFAFCLAWHPINGTGVTGWQVIDRLRKEPIGVMQATEQSAWDAAAQAL